MTTFLLPECLENIFSHLLDESFSSTSTGKYKDLHSCTLVSRHWCRISTPFLYAYPFNPYYVKPYLYELEEDLISYSKLIRTLLSCIPQFEIKRICTTYAQILSAKHISLTSYSDITSTFNYVSFIHGLVLNEKYLNSQTLVEYKKIWLSAYNPEKILLESPIVKVMNNFLEFLSKNCNNLTMLEISLDTCPSNKIELSQIITSLLRQRRLKYIKFS